MPTLESVVVSISRSAVLLAAAVTTLALIAIGGWQTATCWRFGACRLSVEQVFERADILVSRSYFTASIDSHRSPRLDLQDFSDLLLDMPAIVPLSAAVALLVVFHVWLRLIATTWHPEGLTGR
jgi:hypothetical protein